MRNTQRGQEELGPLTVEAFACKAMVLCLEPDGKRIEGAEEWRIESERVQLERVSWPQRKDPSSL